MRTCIFAVLLALCAATSVVLSYRIEQTRKEATLEEVMWVSSPRAARYMSLGYTGLAADIYWTRAVQYFGGKHSQRSRQYKLLEPLLNLTTQLDPQLLIAYYFGSFFLAQSPPEGAGDPDAAVRLVERGIEHNPDEWRLYYHLGLIHYLERHDYPAAADAFERGAQNPNALAWMRVMAATMRQRSGNAGVARYLWAQIYQNTEDKNVRQNALRHLAALKADDDVLYLEGVVNRFQLKHGMPPGSIRELVAEGYLAGIPIDPAGLPYVLKNGRVEVQDVKQLPFITRGLPTGEKPYSSYLP